MWRMLMYPPRYIKETLIKDEKLVYFTRPHWIIYGPGVIALIFAALFYTYGPAYFILRSRLLGGYPLYDLCSFFASALGAFWLLTAYVTYRTSEYGVTDKRVIMKKGWIRRNSLEIFLRRLEGVDVNQTVTGRILGYGTLVISGMGGSRDYYTNVPQPLMFRKYVQRQVDLLIDASEETQS
ncbi:PH domain-containing protein [Coxiella burnetii]|uniref:PH domain-containing protein n=1 Tax=Coxiella burnetii TaxID=777 RepID=UPI000183CCFF|nr:PH domain-containing protein [Coxiella burnetii]ACJ19481.1 hypothetical membrane-associated protein [Coxiella burnetii CbuK_Q154]EAX34030.2 hypothetical protein A35_00815 [Coxiella burnetii 'MSU Goat Q177']UYK69551.1 PH domain-containing protein [Coxiella burnetii]